MTVSAVEAPSAPDSVPGAAIPFPIASRPQKRYANVQTVNNLAGSGSFQVIQLAASGWVRRISMLFSQSVTSASAGAVVSGDGPWNLIRGITLTDATGQPVVQPISGYNLYLVNKYFSSGSIATNLNRPFANPMLSPEYAFASTATTGTATFRLDLDFEIDPGTGYGCIPNLDSNASLQLKIDYDVYSVAFTGTTVSAASLAVRVSQEYWAPVGSSLGGAAVANEPLGAGDYVETRYETQTVSASAENLVTLTNRGGLIKGMLLISRAAGVRTAITAASNLGLLLDNQPINEGVPIEEHYDQIRRGMGYYGADLTTSYAPLSAGVMSGLDRGVVPVNFDMLSAGRDSWLNTRAGSLLQVKLTPGASATTLEVVTQLAQVKNPSAFFTNGGA
jgi:hypothetical protein